MNSFNGRSIRTLDDKGTPHYPVKRAENGASVRVCNCGADWVCPQAPEAYQKNVDASATPASPITERQTF